MGNKLDRFRDVFKGIENASYFGGVGVLASTLGIVPALSDKVKEVTQAVLEVLPDPVTISSNVPGLASLLSQSEVAQNIGLLLDIGGIALAAKFIATLLKLCGAQRSKLEKVLSGTVKLGAAGVLGASGASHLAGSESIDVLQPFLGALVDGNGDVYDWAVKREGRLNVSALVSAGATGLLTLWAYLQDFRGLYNPKIVEKNSGLTPST